MNLEAIVIRHLRHVEWEAVAALDRVCRSIVGDYPIGYDHGTLWNLGAGFGRHDGVRLDEVEFQSRLTQCGRASMSGSHPHYSGSTIARGLVCRN